MSRFDLAVGLIEVAFSKHVLVAPATDIQELWIFVAKLVKGAWGMSRYQKAMKGVEVCEKPGGVDKRALIPGFPNCSCAESIGAWRRTR